jgi:hypothetical protein
MRQEEKNHGDCAEHQLQHHQLPGAHIALSRPSSAGDVTSSVLDLVSHVHAECWLLTKMQSHCFVFNSIRLFFTVILMCRIYAFKDFADPLNVR